MLVMKCENKSDLIRPKYLQILNSIIERRLGEEWIILYRMEESFRAYSFGFCVKLVDEAEESLAEVSLEGDELELTLPWDRVKIGKGEEAIIPMDIAMISLSSFRNPQLILEEGLLSKVLFYMNPHIWSDPSLTGASISSIYRNISEKLELKRRYYSFVRAIHFMSSIDNIKEFAEAFRALASIGIAPPIGKMELFHLPDLSPIEMNVLRVLCAKEAIDRITGLSERQVASLFSDLIGILSSDPRRARLTKSIMNRSSREGLTLTELSLSVGVDKAYLWRYVIPKMVNFCLIRAEKDLSRGRELKVYRANPFMPSISDIIMTYSIKLSHLLGMRGT